MPATIRNAKRKEKFILMHNRGDSIYKIARALKFSVKYARRLAVERGLINKRIFPSVDWDKVERMRKSRININHIAKEFGLTLHQFMNRAAYHQKPIQRIRLNINIKKSTQMYVQGYSTSAIADILKCQTHDIRRCWKRAGLSAEILKKKRLPKTKSEQLQWRIKVRKERQKATKDSVSRYDASMLKRPASFKIKRGGIWIDLRRYKNKEAALLLSRYLNNSPHNMTLPVRERAAFLPTFYNNSAFRCVFRFWLKNGRKAWARPSMDHVVPLNRGGRHNIRNIRFMIFIENVMKSDRNDREWKAFCTDMRLDPTFLLSNLLADYKDRQKA